MDKKKMPKAIIIIPTYNEKDNIGRLVEHLFSEIFPTIKSYDMHILVVDDSSPDGTAAVVTKLQKKHSNLHLKVNKKKMGLGGAYMSGMAHAIDKLNADVVFEMDADFSHDPSIIPNFLKKIDEGYDLVLGSRYIKGGAIPKNWGIHRKFLSIVGNFVIRLIITHFAVRDWTGGYRAIKKELFQTLRNEMKRSEFAGYTFQIGFLHKTIRKGFKVTEVPFKFIDREYGKSKLGSEYIKNTLKYIITIRIKELDRLIKFGVVGTVGFIINYTALQVFSLGFGLSEVIATMLGAELAIISNFILNNIWTFKDRKITVSSNFLMKFLQFNLTSLGAIIIQGAVMWIGIKLFGQSLYQLYFVIAVGISMIFNFIVYNKIIWKNK